MHLMSRIEDGFILSSIKGSELITAHAPIRGMFLVAERNPRSVLSIDRSLEELLAIGICKDGAI